MISYKKTEHSTIRPDGRRTQRFRIFSGTAAAQKDRTDGEGKGLQRGHLLRAGIKLPLPTSRCPSWVTAAIPGTRTIAPSAVPAGDDGRGGEGVVPGFRACRRKAAGGVLPYALYRQEDGGPSGLGREKRHQMIFPRNRRNPPPNPPP